MTGGRGWGPLNSPGCSIFGSLHLLPYVLVPTCIQTKKPQERALSGISSCAPSCKVFRLFWGSVSVSSN